MNVHRPSPLLAGRSALLGLFFALALGSAAAAPLVLQEQGSFFVGGDVIVTDFARGTTTAPANHITANQMYVQYQIPYAPFGATKLPVIMVPGSNHTTKCYETTPDGREGWAEYFLRRGYPVYLVDQAGRARSGFDPSLHNQGLVQSAPGVLRAISSSTYESAWIGFRFGPTYGTFWPGTQFPTAALDEYFKQLVPNTESQLVGTTQNTINGIALLLDRIGPAILMTHSQSGTFGVAATLLRPNLVKALVSVEPGVISVNAADLAPVWRHVPFLCVFGDHIDQGFQPRFDGCNNSVNQINAASGNGYMLSLPAQGLPGNTHMLMLDRNSSQSAELMVNWLGANVH